MKNNNDATIVIILILGLLILFSGFGMMGLGGMMQGVYGSNWMCGMMGGIWCYWPSFGWIIQILVVAVLVLLIVWLIRQMRGEK